MRPRIVADDGQIGFYWTTPDGTPCTLQSLVASDDEPDRLTATHLAALDDALIDAAGRFGELLGGGRRPDPDERAALTELHHSLDGLCADYAAAAATGIGVDARAGKIIGTAALMSILARAPLGLLGPAPLDGELDTPSPGVVGGYGDMTSVDEQRPWKGARWVVRTESGQRLPLTLQMLLFDSSGVNKEAARREHREAIESVLAAAGHPDADPLDVACALDWLLYDWLMAHRDGPDSAEIVMVGDAATQQQVARMIVRAAAASVAARATVDPALAI
ncbi:MAG: hypothetical protein HYZ38_21005 [Mycobacterium sp.]|nr:hypothetical protein [Mycobacterium sp.]